LWLYLQNFKDLSEEAPKDPAQQIAIRVVVLVLWTTWCYGVQVLLEKQRAGPGGRRGIRGAPATLRAAGRLAAEIAHGIKNPLGIINTTAYSLQQALQQQRPIKADSLGMIRDEVAKADAIITRLMGYAQLAEGRVELLNVGEELDHAVREIFPPGAGYTTRIEKHVAPGLPSLPMQRLHLTQILENILLNAREALDGKGEVVITAQLEPNDTIAVTIADNGPGIPGNGSSGSSSRMSRTSRTGPAWGSPSRATTSRPTAAVSRPNLSLEKAPDLFYTSRPGPICDSSHEPGAPPVLVVDDERNMCTSLQTILRDAGYEAKRWKAPRKACGRWTARSSSW